MSKGGLVVGTVLSVDAVPGKSNLRSCKVDVGAVSGDGEPLTIVTNCSNVREGTHTVVALIGTELEVNGETMTVAKTNVGGVYSSGMLCDSVMCGWVGGAAGLCVQVPSSLARGSPAPTSKPRIDGGGSSGAGVSATAEPEMSEKDRKAKEKADRKALAAAKKAARKEKGKKGEGEGGEEAEGEEEERAGGIEETETALGKASLGV